MADTTLHEEIQAAEAEIATGHPEAALERCQQLQGRFPRALVIQRVLGETYLAQRKAREALAVLERALEGDPEDARACCARALVHQIHGDSSAALAWYRRACDIRPDDKLLRAAYRELATHLNQPPYRPTSFGLARLYLRGALFTHAEREWQAILAEQPDRLDAQVGLAETLWRAGDDARALDLARRIVNNTGTCVKALLIVSALEHASGNDDEARRLLARAAELDPERRIGLALYSDRFASGDLALHRLLLGEDGGGASALAIDDLPTQHVPAAMVPRVPGVPVAGGASAELEEFNAFAQSRTTQIPADFHQIFAETEFMLWGKDEDAAAPESMQRAPASGLLDPMQRSRVERPQRAMPSASLPALPIEGEPTDTDARMSAGWVRWLQALGAQPLGARAAGPAPQESGQRAPEAVPHDTGPLAPGQQALRNMFAELDTRRAQPTAGPASGALDVSAFAASAASAQRENGASPAATPPAAASGLPTVTTIEELEQQFAASGFAPVELRPGTLHAAAQTAPPAARPTLPTAREAEPTPAAAEPAVAAPAPAVPAGLPVWGVSVPLPETPAEVTAPAAPGAAEPEGDDYMSQLRRARRRRAEGRNEEALLEYRGVLRDSPDMLDDLIHDLRDMSATMEDPEVHRLLADAYIREGNYTDAIESYNRAHALTQSQQG